MFAVITYKFPILSAKAVPDLQNFLTKWVVNQYRLEVRDEEEANFESTANLVAHVNRVCV